MARTRKKVHHLLWLLPLLLAGGYLLYQHLPGTVLTRPLADPQVALTATGDEPWTGETTPLINADHAVAEPQKLINLYAQKNRGFSLASSEIELTEAAFQAAKAMFEAAADQGVEGFILSSGYRSREKQAEEYNRDPVTAAPPGHSEHGSGLAFDVTAYGPSDFSKTPQYRWLYRHCWDYGFILRYPSDKTELTGIPAESWHYRYVGQPHARIMGEQGLCMEEYVAWLQEEGPFRAEYQGQIWIIGADDAGILYSLPHQ